LKTRHWVILPAIIVAIGGLLSASESVAQGVVAVRDDANGYLCFDFRAWGQCFAYTATVEATTTTPSTVTQTTTPIIISSSTATPSPTTTPTSTQTVAPSSTATETPTSKPPNTLVPPSTATPVAVVLVNGGLEDWSADIPAGWTPFVLGAVIPSYGAERLSNGASVLAVYEGDSSLRMIAHHQCFRAGIQQTLMVPVGTRIRFSAMLKAFGSQFDGMENADGNMNWIAGIGIDPKGFDSASNSRIEWSLYDHQNTLEANIGGALQAKWIRMTVDSIAESNRVTVFVYAALGATLDSPSACQWPIYQTLAFIDKVVVEILP